MIAPRIMLILILASLTACARPMPPTQAAAETPLGIVLMHGKKGLPTYLADIKATLEDHGYLVATPEMCWSNRRMYDRAYLDCLTEIDAAIAGLRQRGAKSIVVAGHSLGGTAAVAYGASHEGLAGIIGFAAGDAFFGPPSRLPDIARARALVEQGKGDSLGQFGDITPGGDIRMQTTAAHFLSFVSLPAEQRLAANVARLRAPILFIAGTLDMATLQYSSEAYARAPGYALDRFVRVAADHGGTLRAGLNPALEWLDRITRGS